MGYTRRGLRGYLAGFGSPRVTGMTLAGDLTQESGQILLRLGSQGDLPLAASGEKDAGFYISNGLFRVNGGFVTDESTSGVLRARAGIRCDGEFAVSPESIETSSPVQHASTDSGLVVNLGSGGEIDLVDAQRNGHYLIIINKDAGNSVTLDASATTLNGSTTLAADGRALLHWVDEDSTWYRIV